VIAIDNAVEVSRSRSDAVSSSQPWRYSYSVRALVRGGRKICIATDRGVRIRLEPVEANDGQPLYHMYLNGEAVLIPTSFDTKESFRIKEPSLTEKERITLIAGSYSETHMIRTVRVQYR
jgi:hypothetical protein